MMMPLTEDLSWRKADCYGPACIGQGSMRCRDARPGFFKMVAMLIAVVIFLGAPALAIVHPCDPPQATSTSHSHSDGHHADQKAKAFDFKACCASSCTICLTTLSEAGPYVLVAVPSHPTIDWPSRLAGREPSPGFEPPRLVA